MQWSWTFLAFPHLKITWHQCDACKATSALLSSTTVGCRLPRLARYGSSQSYSTCKIKNEYLQRCLGWEHPIQAHLTFVWHFKCRLEQVTGVGHLDAHLLFSERKTKRIYKCKHQSNGRWKLLEMYRYSTPVVKGRRTLNDVLRIDKRQQIYIKTSFLGFLIHHGNDALCLSDLEYHAVNLEFCLLTSTRQEAVA